MGKKSVVFKEDKTSNWRVEKGINYKKGLDLF